MAVNNALRIEGAPDPDVGASANSGRVMVEIHVPSRACSSLTSALGGVCGSPDPSRGRSSASVGSFEVRSLGRPLSLQAWSGASFSLSLTQATLRSERDNFPAWALQEAGGKGRVIITCARDASIVLAAGQRRLETDCSTGSTTYRRLIVARGLPTVALYLNGIARLEVAASAESAEARVGGGQLQVADDDVTLGNGRTSTVLFSASDEQPVHLHLIDSNLADLSQLVLTSRSAQVSISGAPKNPTYLDKYSTPFYSVFALIGAALFAALIDLVVRKRTDDQ
jgi:hypothetical protein